MPHETHRFPWETFLSLPLALYGEARAQALCLAFGIKQMFLRSLMEMSYASFPGEGKNAVLKQPFLLSFFLSFSPKHRISSAEGKTGAFIRR